MIAGTRASEPGLLTSVRGNLDAAGEDVVTEVAPDNNHERPSGEGMEPDGLFSPEPRLLGVTPDPDGS